jgi:hypothetical protein
MPQICSVNSILQKRVHDKMLLNMGKAQENMPMKPAQPGTATGVCWGENLYNLGY